MEQKNKFFSKILGKTLERIEWDNETVSRSTRCTYCAYYGLCCGQIKGISSLMAREVPEGACTIYDYNWTNGLPLPKHFYYFKEYEDKKDNYEVDNEIYKWLDETWDADLSPSETLSIQLALLDAVYIRNTKNNGN